MLFDSYGVQKHKYVTQTFPDGVPSYLHQLLLVAKTARQTEQLKRVYLGAQVEGGEGEAAAAVGV